MLVRKAHLHVAAALRANQSNNMHSLAAQMRPALECAGQVVTTMKNIRDGSSKARESVMRRANADFYQSVKCVGRGQFDPRKILEDNPNIQLASHHMYQVKGRFDSQEAGKVLKHGECWYKHLSQSFYHAGMSELEGNFYYGGVLGSAENRTGRSGTLLNVFRRINAVEAHTDPNDFAPGLPGDVERVSINYLDRAGHGFRRFLSIGCAQQSGATHASDEKHGQRAKHPERKAKSLAERTPH